MGQTKTVNLFGHEVQLLLSGVLPVIQNLNYKLQKILSNVLPNQQSNQKYVQRCTCACYGTLSGFPQHYHVAIALAFGRGAVAKPSRDFPLQYHLFITLTFKRGAVVRLSRHNQAHRLAVRWLGRVDSHYVSPFESKFDLMTYRESPPPELYPETHRRNRYEERILYTTTRRAVPDVTLKSNLYVFLACSIWCQM